MEIWDISLDENSCCMLEVQVVCLHGWNILMEIDMIHLGGMPL